MSCKEYLAEVESHYPGGAQRVLVLRKFQGMLTGVVLLADPSR